MYKNSRKDILTALKLQRDNSKGILNYYIDIKYDKDAIHYYQGLINATNDCINFLEGLYESKAIIKIFKPAPTIIVKKSKTTSSSKENKKMKKDVIVGLMTFAVDESKANEFEESLKRDLDQIDYVYGENFDSDKNHARFEAIQDNCKKFGASII